MRSIVSWVVSERPDELMRREFERLGTSRPFRRGDLLMVEGTASDEVLLIESGAVNVMLTSRDGVETMVGPYGPGEVIGDIGVMRRKPRSATVVGQQDGRALHMPASAFRTLVENDNGMLLRIIYDMAYERQLSADRRQLAVASLGVRARVAERLLEWGEKLGQRHGDTIVVRDMTQQQLAAAVAASRQAVEAVLREMRDAGLLETGRARITLLRPDLLAAELRTPGQ